jgi:hypothetical protein
VKGDEGDNGAGGAGEAEEAGEAREKSNAPCPLTLRILDFGFWILDSLGYKPQRHLLPCGNACSEYAGKP